MRSLSLLGVLVMTIPTLAADPAQFDFPNLLLLSDGQAVTTKQDWESKRKPELKELFQKQMYGRYPSVATKVSGKVLFDDPKAFGGAGILREVEVSMGIPDCPPIYLLIAVPNERPKAGAPVFVGINFGGNHLLTTDERVRIPTVWMPGNDPGVKNNQATAEGRGKHAEKWPLEQIVKAGYAVATFYTGDIDPDNKDKREGMRPYITPLPKGERPDDFPGSIMCWAWGIHRAVDYVISQPEFEPKRVAVVGHSRLGKTALLAAAFDERIAVAFPLQAGCGGTAPSRHADPKAETVKRINTSFPHWFSTSFKSYNDDPTKLPFDQHGLLALCAPRPVLYANATEDLWANPSGQFDMMRRATPVYELLGVEGMKATTMPETGRLVDSRLGFWIRAGKHEMNPDDWKTFLTFAGKWLK
jgi:hypothetical protein